MLRCAFITGLAALALQGCTQPGVTSFVAPVLDARTIQSIAFQGADVDVRALERVFNTPDERSVPVQQSLEEAAKTYMVWNIGGDRLTRVKLVVTSLKYERGVAGLYGEDVAVMRGTVSLVDATTGAVIVAPTDIFSTAIGWVADGLQPDVTLADRGTELTELAEQFVARASRALLGG